LTRTHTGGRPGSGRWELAKSGDSGEVSPDGDNSGAEPGWSAWVGAAGTADRWSVAVEPEEESDTDGASASASGDQQGDGSQTESETTANQGGASQGGVVGLGGAVGMGGNDGDTDEEEEEATIDTEAYAWLFAIYAHFGVAEDTALGWFDAETFVADVDAALAAAATRETALLRTLPTSSEGVTAADAVTTTD